MGFTKLSVNTNRGDKAPCPSATPETDIWAIFRALRDTRSLFGLRPGHMQTLQAMLSFLRPGQGDTVFASNHEICRRIGGIDERTLRRHIDRFVALGFMTRRDSPNRKRYRVRSSDGQAISFGLSLAPLMARATELLTAAQEMENARRDRLFLRKKVLTRLAVLEEAHPDDAQCKDIRRMLRRKLTVAEYQAILVELDAACHDMSTAVDTAETVNLPANDGQIVRHQSRSIKKQKDIDSGSGHNLPDCRTLTEICEEATSLAIGPLRDWPEVEAHARKLAPMMGIAPDSFEKAVKRVGPRKAASAIFILLQIGSRVRNFGAYFHSITLGRRISDFHPAGILAKLARGDTAHA